jgi:hypothetical protein
MSEEYPGTDDIGEPTPRGALRFDQWRNLTPSSETAPDASPTTTAPWALTTMELVPPFCLTVNSRAAAGRYPVGR